MPLYKCEDCGFEFRATEEPEECLNCKAQDNKKKKGFAEVPEEPPDAVKSSEPQYHWQCKTCGYEFVGVAIPQKCPNCEAQNEHSKGFAAKTPAARLKQAQAEQAAKEAKAEEVGEPPPVVNDRTTKREIIAALMALGETSIEVNGVPKRLDECIGTVPPNREDLIFKYKQVTGQEDTQ